MAYVYQVHSPVKQRKFFDFFRNISVNLWLVLITTIAFIIFSGFISSIKIPVLPSIMVSLYPPSFGAILFRKVESGTTSRGEPLDHGSPDT